MKRLLTILFLLTATTAYGGDWDSSPSNWENSESNWENSSSNWRNSPSNYENSPTKYGNDRIVYDEDGEPTGYAVPKKSGGVNIYDLKGKRKAYTPATSAPSHKSCKSYWQFEY